jgi:hypothetical protein
LLHFRRMSVFYNIDFLRLGFTQWVVFLSNLFSHLINAFRGFTDLETHAWYTPGVPMLRPFYAAFFLLGIVLLLRQWKDNRTLLLMSWVAMIGMVGGFSESTPAAQRYIAGAPVAVLIAGYGFAEIADILGKFWPDRQRWVYYGFLTLVLISALSDVYFYFKVYTPKSLMLDQNTRTIQKLADYLHGKQGNWQVLFYGTTGLGYHSINTVAFLEPSIVGVDATHPWGSPENPKPISKNTIFIFLPGHTNDLSGAMRDYPGGKKLDIVDPNMGQLFTIYELSPFQQSP